MKKGSKAERSRSARQSRSRQKTVIPSRSRSFDPRSHSPTNVERQQSYHRPKECVGGPDIYGTILGRTVDEQILAGLQALFNICGECRQEEMGEVPLEDSSPNEPLEQGVESAAEDVDYVVNNNYVEVKSDISHDSEAAPESSMEDIVPSPSARREESKLKSTTRREESQLKSTASDSIVTVLSNKTQTEEEIKSEVISEESQTSSEHSCQCKPSTHDCECGTTRICYSPDDLCGPHDTLSQSDSQESNDQVEASSLHYEPSHNGSQHQRFSHQGSHHKPSNSSHHSHHGSIKREPSHQSSLKRSSNHHVEKSQSPHHHNLKNGPETHSSSSLKKVTLSFDKHAGSGHEFEAPETQESYPGKKSNKHENTCYCRSITAKSDISTSTDASKQSSKSTSSNDIDTRVCSTSYTCISRDNIRKDGSCQPDSCPKEAASTSTSSLSLNKPKSAIKQTDCCSRCQKKKPTPKKVALCECDTSASLDQSQSGDGSHGEVRYAITKITKFTSYTTYEVLKSTGKKPKVMPTRVEGVFVLKNRSFK
ncbi:unnamed protein product [Ceutorhynchus assimilis]|uniref:Uncharacterized protein n=1 Tax=Ceutorhynchus assimilis TaxID=467358 RepID=A0A9N9N1Y3_9CUCU|nr:unnamed protein product [Ceutorhynchus assimilis]